MGPQAHKAGISCTQAELKRTTAMARPATGPEKEQRKYDQQEVEQRVPSTPGGEKRSASPETENKQKQRLHKQNTQGQKMLRAVGVFCQASFHLTPVLLVKGEQSLCISRDHCGPHSIKNIKGGRGRQAPYESTVGR